MTGYSLLELMTALGMAALLGVLGLPPLTAQWDRARLDAGLAALGGSLLFARGEAQRLQRAVHVCAAHINRVQELVGCRGRPGDGGYRWDGALVFFNGAEGDVRYQSGNALRLNLFDAALAVRSAASPLRVAPDGRIRPPVRFILRLRRQCAVLDVDASGHGKACRGERCAGCR